MIHTLKYAKMMEEVGFSRSQAETWIKILVETMEDKLASKQDLLDLGAATRQDLKDHAAAFKQELKDHAAAFKQELKDHGVASQRDMATMNQKFDLALGNHIAETKIALNDQATTLREEMSTSTQSLKLEMKDLEFRLTMRMGTMLAATIGILTAIQKLT
jgi:hypothetical protein